MFSPVLGRAVRSTSCISTPSVCAVSRSAALTAAQQPFRPAHQRRLSSSKTSIPPDGSNPNETSSAQQSKQAKQASQRAAKTPAKKQSGKSGKKRVTATSATKAFNVPFVAPTDHLKNSDVKLSSFFSLHRPISITSNIPHERSGASFDDIFKVRASNDRKAMSYTISTLSGGIDSLESALRGEEQRQAPEETMQHEVEVLHLDGPPTQALIDEFVGRLTPFTPPPVPVPFDQRGSASETLLDPKVEETSVTAAIKQRAWSTAVVFTESTDSAGKRTYSATSAPIFEIAVPAAENGQQMEETALRQKQRQKRRNGMMLISVKRQRKLKMKKHKYKKLMKRTRLLRRKLDRL